MMRIIDDRQVDLTPDEWEEYQRLCQEYTTVTVEGKHLFRGLLTVNNDGIIISVHPGKGYLSMEIWLFLACVMQNQHLRLMYRQLNEWKEQFQQQSKAHMERLAEELKPKQPVVEVLPPHTSLKTTVRDRRSIRKK